MKLKQWSSTLLVLLLLCSVPVAAETVVQPEPLPEHLAVYLEEYDLDLPGYLVDGVVYTPVKTFVEYFGFSVHYNHEAAEVTLVYGQQEEGKDNEETMLAFVEETGRQVAHSPHSFSYEGTSYELGLLLIDGYNFVRVDTIAAFFGFHCSYEEETETLTISRDPLAAMSRENKARYEAYIEAHTQPLEFGRLAPLADSNLDAYHVYFLGETHGVSQNYDLQLYFIQYLHETYGLRYVIREMGFCDAMIENEFLKTGDPSGIRDMLSNYVGTSFGSQDQYDFYRKLYEYNQTLPEAERLILIGIDVQHSFSNGLSYVQSLLKQFEEAPLIQGDLEVLNGMMSQTAFQLLCQKVRNQEEAYRAAMGDQYDLYRFSLRSIEQAMSHNGANGNMEVRERFIRENFTALYEYYDVDRCFGMLGSMHVTLNGYFGSTPNLAQYLNTGYAPTEKSVAAIMVDYVSCNFMEPGTGDAYPVPSGYSETVSRMMAGAAQQSAAFLRLDHAESIFSEDGFTVGFQYYLSLKNSAAAVPFQK